MEWMRDELNFFINRSNKEHKEFDKQNNLLVLSRIRLISLTNIFLSIFWGYMDFIIIKNGANRNYSITLIAMHVISVIASVIFLFFYKWIDNNENFKILYIVLKIYVFLYILFGAISSINSQRYSGNIYSYIILSLIASIALTLKPMFMLFAFGINHFIFLVGISIYCSDIESFLGKFINSTVLACAAFLLGVIFYRHRMMEFLYREKLIENEENLKKLFYVNPYPVFITRMKDGKMIDANKRACALLEINEDTSSNFEQIDFQIKNDVRMALEEELLKHSSTFNKIVEYEYKGKQMWVTANYELIDYHGEKCILTGIMDITEIRKAEEELSHYASIDSLTGILNRRMGLKKLEELLLESKKKFLEFVLCFLDMNNLKSINDTYGHGEGDRYIQSFVELVKESLEKEDVFFRMGGDEFIIIFKNKNISQVETIWDNCVNKLEQKNSTGELHYNITASHGLYYYCSDIDIDLDQIIEKADKQMYKEKQRFKSKGFH